MRKEVWAGVFIIAGCVAYILVINLISFFLSFQLPELGTGEAVQSGTSGDVLIGIGDTISVGIERHRWYGSITETGSGKSRSRILHLFGFIRLPLEINGTNMFLVQLFVIAAIACAVYACIHSMRRNAYERGFF